MGLSASQIGLPVNAVYIERNDNSSVLLIDPKLKPNTKNAYPELFIKLISLVSNKLYPLFQKDSKFYFQNL